MELEFLDVCGKSPILLVGAKERAQVKIGEMSLPSNMSLMRSYQADPGLNSGYLFPGEMSHS